MNSTLAGVCNQTRINGLVFVFLGQVMLQILSVPPQKSANNKSLTGAGKSFVLFLVTTLPHSRQYLIWVALVSSTWLWSFISTDVFFKIFFPQRRKTLFRYSNPARWNNSAAASRQPQPSRSAHGATCKTVNKGANPQSAQRCLRCFAGFIHGSRWTAGFRGWQKSQPANVPPHQTTTHSV